MFKENLRVAIDTMLTYTGCLVVFIAPSKKGIPNGSFRRSEEKMSNNEHKPAKNNCFQFTRKILLSIMYYVVILCFHVYPDPDLLYWSTKLKF